MNDEPSHVKQLSPNHVCKIGLKWKEHCKKTLAVFPSPDGMSLIKPSLDGNNLIFPVQREYGK